MYKHQFDDDRKRVANCPCGKSNDDGKFSPFVGHEKYGYCFGCDKLFDPDSASPVEKKVVTYEDMLSSAQPDEPIKHSLVPPELVKKSFSNYGSNTLVEFLIKLIGSKNTTAVIKKYRIGTSQYWPGSTVFWQLTREEDKEVARAGKIIPFKLLANEASVIGLDCKRNKEYKLPVKWVHKAEKLNDFVLKQCFFGEHLLYKNPGMAVAIVESEKTAVIASVYLPQFIWLATGGIASLNSQICTVLKGRSIMLFPDVTAYDSWKEKAKQLSGISTIIVSDLLELKATDAERTAKLDLADYLIRFSHNDFLTQANTI